MSKTSDPKPIFTLDELRAFLEAAQDEPEADGFYSSKEWSERLGCNVRRIRLLLRELMDRGALEPKRAARLAIDGYMRPVSVYKINLKAEEEAPA